MTESLAVPQPAPLPAAIEQALIAGDLSSLSTEHRVLYYQAKCKSLGLNPLTQPFGYLRLNGKLVLYALKDAKEQLRKMHGISLEVLEQWRQDTLYFVRVRANTPDGRFDEDMGFAELGNLKGEALGNAMLKAMTKAKSRVTLSICGLGGVDETEVESIPEAVIEDQESPAVQKAMDRFYAKDAEVKAAQEPTSPFVHTSPQTPDASRAAQGQASARPSASGSASLAMADEKATTPEPTSPFVPAEKTPGGIPSTGTASPSTPPPEAGASAPERKPRTPRQSKTHEAMNTKQLLQAIQAQFTRLCGTDKDAMRDMCRHAFGSLVRTWQGVTELSDPDLRLGLAKLEPMVKEEPPADHSHPFLHIDEHGMTHTEEDVPSFPPPRNTDADVCPYIDMDRGQCDRTFNHPGEHIFLPLDGNPQEGPQEAQGGTIVNHEHNGLTQEGKVASNEQQAEKNICVVVETGTGIPCVRDAGHQGAHYFTPSRPGDGTVKLPERPLVMDGYISTSDMRILERWCQQHDQAQLFASAVAKNPRNLHGNVLVTEQQWQWIKMTVETLEQMHASQEAKV